MPNTKAVELEAGFREVTEAEENKAEAEREASLKAQAQASVNFLLEFLTRPAVRCGSGRCS